MQRRRGAARGFCKPKCNTPIKMTAANIQLQRPTTRTVTGPRFHTDGSRIIVEYDCEEDQGEVAWSEVSFEEVLAFEYRQVACCRADDVVGAHEIRCLEKSTYLSGMIDRWQESVGWQESRQIEPITSPKQACGASHVILSMRPEIAYRSTRKATRAAIGPRDIRIIRRIVRVGVRQCRREVDQAIHLI